MGNFSRKVKTFLLSYLMMLDIKKGLSKKSELFTEFVDRNQHYITTQKIIHNSPKNYASSQATEPSSVFKKSLRTKTKLKKTDTNYIFSKPQTQKFDVSSPTSFKNIKKILEEKKLYKIQNHLIKTGAMLK
jgi:hypothetical protein